MKTWKAKILTALIFGTGFTEEDGVLMASFKTCFVGEKYPIPERERNSLSMEWHLNLVHGVELGDADKIVRLGNDASAAVKRPSNTVWARDIYNELNPEDSI